MLDMLIKNGTVVDGTGAAPIAANVGVKDGRITYIGDEQPEANQEIDANGKLVTPGFVDVHTHYDAQILWDPALDPQVRHGFTTILIGQCGFGLAPVTPETMDYLVPMLAKVEAIPPETLAEGVDLNWSDMKGYLDNLEGNVLANIGVGTGHSAIRTFVMGDRAFTEANATEEELEQMKSVLRESLEAGSIGFTTSHSETHRDHLGNPVPSLVAHRDELMALAAEVKEYEGTHLGMVPQAKTKSTEVKQLLTDFSLAGERTVNWPFFVPTMYAPDLEEDQLSTADFARKQGAEVRIQCLSAPSDVRINFRTGFAYDTFPGIFQDLYHVRYDERCEMMQKPEVREAMREVLAVEAEKATSPLAVFAKLENFIIEACDHPDNQKYVGRNLAEIAEEEGKTVLDACLDITIKDKLITTFVVAHFPQHTKEGWAKVAESLSDDRTLWGGTDGGAHLDILCQYAHGTAFLSKGVREHKVMPVEKAINLFTQVPAEFVGVKDRGVLKEGAHADILVIDLERIETKPLEVRADLPAEGMRLFADAVGYDYVIVNGVPVVQNDQYTGEKAGTVLRRGRDTYTAKIPATQH